MDDKVVSITMKDGLPVPDQDPIEIRKDNQKVRWCADFDFRITVDGYSDIQYTPGGSACAFQAKSGAFGTIKKYKYTISANGVDNDPMIDVKP